MTTKKITLDDFQIEKLSKSHQKTVQGGDDNEEIDPSKGTGKGNGQY